MSNVYYSISSESESIEHESEVKPDVSLSRVGVSTDLPILTYLSYYNMPILT